MNMKEDLEQLVQLDWTTCESCTTLDDLKQVEAVKTIRDGLLEMGGYERCSIGLNAGTTFVSFNLRLGNGSPGNNGSVWARVLAVMLCANQKVDMFDAKLANECIEVFADRTGVALCHVTWNPKNKALRAVFCSTKTVRDKLSGKTLWRYSPSYVHFFDFTSPAQFPPLYDGNAPGKIAELVVENIWEEVRAAHYIIDQTLQPKLDQELREYVKQGLVGPGEAFEPSSVLSKRLGFYLHGSAGVGKSTFVGLLCRGMENAFKKFINPSIQVHVVKVPLNSISPKDLQHILRIQGISDWSIERMVEQGIAKGNLIILHLEENPEEQDLQNTMFDLVDGMLNHLFQKYPERVGMVLYGFTSNYAPCQKIESIVKTICTVNPPSPDDQFHWARSMLQDRVQATLKELAHQITVTAIEIDENARPPATQDMRPLNNWWLSLGFYCCLLVIQHLSDEHEVEEAQQHLCVLNIQRSGDQLLQVGVNDHQTILLKSGDSFFYTKFDETPIRSIAQMSVFGYTTPSVIFIDRKNGEGLIEQCEDEIKRICSEEKAHLRCLDMGTLMDEDDKIKIYGDPSLIRGGLFEFIDDTNNPHVETKKTVGDCLICGKEKSCSAKPKNGDVRVALVKASLSQTGQFMLRELLESSARSRTHRLGISKKHVIFLLTILPDHPLTPQAISRAHLILK